ncbi:hypothetical protein [Bacterioplanoides sp. SCSIO 12839]|uniref:hypothetical protein n=1 Tax=Bacterioplanoides sp. SCSIO 12839 TaxID=2829569 RepID=UPI002103E665|nr:hypothetical protein [Bacterioplanoides sp. SCSIO 12839]UTW48361.1 hypothetical protein KFF03_00175 [Bacterioplanoides sp. SCSIO 12839]
MKQPPSFSLRNSLNRLLTVAGVVVISGCATYGSGVQQALEQVQQGDLTVAEASFKQTLQPTGNDALLYHLELGVVKHLQGDFAASNQLLNQAEQIAERLETVSITDSLAVLMSNPRQGAYGGAEFEKMFINYYKALNYFGLAQTATSRNDRLDALDGARIESRRLIIRLNDLNSRKGTYAEQKSKDEQTFSQLLDIFDALSGNMVDMDQLVYRDDAMAHYLTGISFEMNGEYDDARISYQKAAQSYEDGFATQFRLDPEMISQAWFDVVRMMRKSGDKEDANQLAKRKLSKQQRAELKRWDDTAQVIVVEHKGMAPHRKEMNLEMSANATLQSFELRPYLFATDRNQLAWFYVLYADKLIFDALTFYLDADAGLLDLPLVGLTKTIYLGPLWDQVMDLGLDQAIGSSMRITVPYYDPVPAEGPSALLVGDRSYDLYKSSNPAQMAVQEQILNSSVDIQMALARASLKALTAAQVAQVGGEFGGLLSAVGKITAQLTDAAETRNWLLLPSDVRIRRVALDAGTHQLTLDSQLRGGYHKRQQTTVTVESGDIHLWRVRSLKPTAVPDPNAVNKRIAQ